MRISFIISSLSSGGAERVLCILANYMSAKHDVYIVTFSNDEPFYEIDENVNHIKLNLLKTSNSFIESFFHSIQRIKILKKTLKEINADVNISFMTHTNILSIVASKLNKQKIIISERIAYDFYNSKLVNIARRVLYPKSDLLVVQTLKDRLNYSFMQNVEVVYNPLVMPNITVNRENIILATGRLTKQKGFEALIREFSKLDTEGWRLCIAGDGEERKNLETLIADLDKNNIELIGNRKDIFEWYARSSIFALSSQKEGFPNVLLEAMASGCACISFDCPNGPSEIIENGENGILVENQNVESLGKCIQKLMHDRDIREKLSLNARSTKNRFAVDKIADKWNDLIKKVVCA